MFPFGVHPLTCLNEDLQMVARDSKPHKELSLHPWIAKIKDLDNHCIIQQQHVAKAVEEAIRSNKRPFASSHLNLPVNNLKPANVSTSASTSMATCDYPPRLTEDECCLLLEHTGCFKCCKFYAGHQAHQCSVAISGKGYKTLMAQYALHAKSFQSTKTSNNNQPNTVAAMTNSSSPNQTEDFIAVVFPSLPSATVGDSSYLDVSDRQ